MKIEIARSEFLKSWQMAERSSSSKSTIGSLGGVLLTAGDDKVFLLATDLKTSICCAASGVRVSEDGSAVLPVKLLGELFKKSPADSIKIEIKNEKGTLTAGRNKTRFSTWSPSEFPKLPKSEAAKLLCDVQAADLLRILTEGSIASSPTDDFPKYLGACMLQVKSGMLNVVSTDGHRLSLSKCSCNEGEETDLLLPITPLRELQRLLAAVDAETVVRILYDGSLAWFQMGQIEFSIRRVESSFPNYEKILNPNTTTIMIIKRDEFLAALDRIDVIVRSYTRLVVLQLSPGGSLKLTGKAPEFGTAAEVLDAAIDGESLTAGFNVAFLQDGLKSLSSDNVKMNLNGEAGQMTMRRDGTEDFLYMLMPVRISEQDTLDPDEDEREPANEQPEQAEPVQAAPVKQADPADAALTDLQELAKTSKAAE